MALGIGHRAEFFAQQPANRSFVERRLGHASFPSAPDGQSDLVQTPELLLAIERGHHHGLQQL